MPMKEQVVLNKLQIARVQKLIDALNGGQYKKAIGSLKRDNCFCVLGVACDLYAKATNKGKWANKYGNGIGWFITEDDSQSDVLPVKAVRDYFGITADSKFVTYYDLMQRNDITKQSFKTIAKFLQTRLDKIKNADIPSKAKN